MADEFKVHLLNDQGLAQCNYIAEAFTGLLGLITLQIPPGRELALVVTHLQQAAFFAKRGIALQTVYQVTQDSEASP